MYFDHITVLEFPDGFFVAMNDANYASSHLWELTHRSDVLIK
jgi:hypothetical protein